MPVHNVLCLLCKQRQHAKDPYTFICNHCKAIDYIILEMGEHIEGIYQEI